MNKIQSTIILGDCKIIMRDLNQNYGQFADAIITSPPYADQRKNQYGGISEKDYPSWTVEWMREASNILKPTGSVFINIRPHIKNGQVSDYTYRTVEALRKDGWYHAEDIMWYKPDSPPLGSIERPRRAWETIHWFGNGPKPWQNCKAGGSESNRIGFENNKFDHGGKSHIHAGQNKAKQGRSRVADVVVAGTSRIEKGYSNEAMYPPEIPEYLINLSVPIGGIVVDPFSGSGTTVRQAIRMGRIGIGIELQERDYRESSESIIRLMKKDR